MTIENTSIKAVALGNGATVVWPYTFLIPDEDQLVVTLIDVLTGNPTVLSPTVYTVTGIGNPLGGTVTLGSALTSQQYIVIERVLPLKQETNLQNQGAVLPAAIESALDYLTMITQQLQDQLNRAIIFSVADTVEVTLPPTTARANLFLGFNADGDPVAVDGLTAGTTVSAAMIPVVTAPTTADALVALGIPGSLLDAMIPAGTIWDYVAAASPVSGFALCYGQPATALWPTLRALLVGAGSPYGTNGVDPLLPDMRARIGVGKSNMGGVDNGLFPGGTVLGAISGLTTVYLTLAQLPIGITSSNVAAINLSVNSGPVNALVGVSASSRPVGGGGANDVWNGSIGASIASLGTIPIGDADVTSNNTGGFDHENRQPSIILTKIIKVH